MFCKSPPLPIPDKKKLSNPGYNSATWHNFLMKYAIMKPSTYESARRGAFVVYKSIFAKKGWWFGGEKIKIVLAGAVTDAA